MKRFAVKLTAVFFVLLFACTSVFSATVYAVDGESSAENGEAVVNHALVLESDHLSVTERKTIQMKASVTNVDTQPQIFWSSSDESVATVDSNGVVKGVGVGKAVIIAKAYIDGETLRGEFAINVVARSNFLRDFLVNQQVLSYQYSYIDDYYYTNDKEAWQYNFGFGKIYDFVSPYILLEYDYIRVFFTYENKDWMLQMWKGQYGLIFYGGEIGIYNRPHSDDGINEWTFFNCPAEEDWLNMEMTLWHEELNGNWTREFTREYTKYWWCTGFKNGHLRQEEPADELRLTGRITLKDAEMTKLVVDGLKECGFGVSETKDGIGLDQIYTEGNDVYFCWQNISEAESTMAIKVGFGALTTLQMLPILPFILPFVQMFALAALLVSVIL
ncbi:MAG: DUF4474 domain-containing protein [Clostridia bacterium]|nr:DUF4474 domain-containing protein [Clostridia bacterium]